MTQTIRRYLIRGANRKFKNNIDRHKFQYSKSYGLFYKAKTLYANLESTDKIP